MKNFPIKQTIYSVKYCKQDVFVKHQAPSSNYRMKYINIKIKQHNIGVRTLVCEGQGHGYMVNDFDILSSTELVSLVKYANQK